MKIRIILIAFTVFSAYSVVSVSFEGDIRNNFSKISTGSGSNVIDVSIFTVKTPENYLYKKAFMWGGDETVPPKTIISAINVSKNKNTIHVPLSTYMDLGDARRISVERISEEDFMLVLEGGDAAGSYRASLLFKGDEIFSRKVVSGEFPEEVWEEAKFSFNHLGN